MFEADIILPQQPHLDLYTFKMRTSCDQRVSGKIGLILNEAY